MKIPRPDIEPSVEKIYKNALQAINEADIPYLVGGGLAYTHHTGYQRDFNDLDLFCKAGDYPKILEVLKEKGFTVTVPDEKWLAKAVIDEIEIDLLSSIPNSSYIVNESWFTHSVESELFGETVSVISAEDLFWSKIYIQTSIRFDGHEMYRMILKTGNTLDWRFILSRMEADWEILFATCVSFRFVFPSERSKVPKWLMEELLDRLRRQLEMPDPDDRICRGLLLSRADYEADIKEGGFIL
jgi:hypothetical protein